MIYYFFYSRIMKIAHKFNWHYAPPIYPDGDTMLWCKWCGFSAVVKRRDKLSIEEFQEYASKEKRCYPKTTLHK